MTTSRVLKEAKWLLANPAFEECPATIREFIGEGYLNIESGVREAIKVELDEIFGDEVSPNQIAKVTHALITGGIGIGKTTIASIILPYMAHWVLCLTDPQGFFDLLPGSRIAFMQMSTSEDQAKEVVFGDIDARIKHSEWFSKWPRDPNFKNQIRFLSKDIWILPGDSAETTFEGYNILGGILDEADSHKITKVKDYAEDGYNTIDNRISSRFQDRGFFLVIGQMKKSNGFVQKKWDEFRKDTSGKYYAVRMTIWESMGWARWTDPSGVRDSFWYDVRRKSIIPTGAVGLITNRDLIEVPNIYKKQFETKPEKALRDLAGIPPAVNDPFISLVHKIDEARDKWLVRYQSVTSPVGLSPVNPPIESWFRALDGRKRACHIDVAYSGDGDALGFAMGHISEVVEIDGEMKPYIVFDMLYRQRAMPGTEIFLGDIRRLIYHLRDDLKFKIKMITTDGFESTEMHQQLQKRRFFTEKASVDRSTLPYEDLREAIYEDRIEFPKYITYINPGDTDQVEIAIKELTELQHTGIKVDHPEGGSKDLADAMAGVVYTLMGDRQYRAGVASVSIGAQSETSQSGNGSMSIGGLTHPALVGLGSFKAPVPPPTAWGKPS